MSDEELYNPLDGPILESFNFGHCFLCGRDLSGIHTKEHVIPKWLCSEFDLWHQTITLLNGTHIRYYQLMIPCCKQCNNEALSRIEDEIHEAFIGGYDSFVNLDEKAIYCWLAKIRWGILYKELSLYVNRANLEMGTIITPEFFEDMRFLHHFMQSMRFEFVFKSNPWSIFLLKLHPYEGPLAFDLYDLIYSSVIALRMGEVGVIACLCDNSTQKEVFGDYFGKFDCIPLNHLQFDELVCKVHYKDCLRNRTPKFLTVSAEGSGRYEVISLPLQGFSSAPIYDDWDQSVYAQLFLYMLQRKGFNVTLDDIYRVENGEEAVLSLLSNENGEVVKTEYNPEICL